MRRIAPFVFGWLLGATPFLLFPAAGRPEDAVARRDAPASAPRTRPALPAEPALAAPSLAPAALEVGPVARLERSIAAPHADEAQGTTTMDVTEPDLSAFLDETRTRLAVLRNLRAEAAALALSRELELGDVDRRAVQELARSLVEQPVGTSAEDVLQAYVDAARLDEEAALRTAESGSLESRLLDAWLGDPGAAAPVRSRRRAEDQERWSRRFVAELDDAATVPSPRRERLERAAREFAAAHWDTMAADPEGLRSSAIRRAALAWLAADLDASQRRLIESLWSIHGLLE